MRSLRLLLVPALAVSFASAQTASTPARHAASSAARPAARSTAAHSAATHSTAAHAAAGGCVTVPQISPKVPALPAGLSCPKALYTITSTPTARLDYVSPLEGPELADYLGLHATSFTLSYIDVKVGDGPLAKPHQYYTIHYTGYLTDGTKFDSSIDRGTPITIPYGERKVIPGWDTGFAGMHVGGKRRLFIPYELAYGANGSGPIPGKSELVFDVELVGVSDTPPPPAAPPAAAHPAAPAQPASPAATPQKPAASSAPEKPATTPANPARP